VHCSSAQASSARGSATTTGSVLREPVEQEADGIKCGIPEYIDQEALSVVGDHEVTAIGGWFTHDTGPEERVRETE
jgi:hypothetical protein